MEFSFNLKQLLFISSWIVILVIALLLAVISPYMDFLGRAELFGRVSAIFGASLVLFVLGFDILKNEIESEKT